MKLNRLLTIVLYHSFLMASSSVCAGNDLPLFNYSIRPKLINTELIPSKERQLKEARFNSALGLLLRNNLLNISLDYTLQGQLRNSKVDDRNLNQIVSASMMSSSLNQLLKANADIRVKSFITEGGNIYSYKFSPVFSKSFDEFAVLSIKYDYRLAKPTRSELIERNRGYSLGLKGKMASGRLTWKSGYMESRVFRDQVTQSEFLEKINFSSRYRISSDMHLELSSETKNRTLQSGAIEREVKEKTYNAGFSWSPSEQYSVAFRIHKIDSNRFEQDSSYSSGSVIWSPLHKLEITFGYGDRLVHGNRGLIFNTKLNVDS